mmetsp:Transcript_26907/g.60151  ORF Transcript_26907/g.60151 Transcript_26907/m.60151 type:complete len:226 (+) Transcript_26907:914-1591(+)
MQDGPVAGELAERVPPLLHALGQLLFGPKHLHRVEGRRVGDHGLLRLDHLAVLEAHAHGPAVLDHDLVHVGVGRELAAELLHAPDQRVGDLDGPAQRHGVRSPLLEEALEDVQHVRGHGALGGESAEDAHGVDEVAQEGVGDDLVHGLVQRVEGEGQVKEHVRVSERVRGGPRRGGEEPRVLPQVEQRHGHGGAPESLEPGPQIVPLLHGQLRVLRPLPDQVLEL